MIAAASRLRRILYAAALLRALAIGMMAVLIGLYCAKLGLTATQIGVVLSAALWGAAAATLLTMVAGTRVSERALLVTLTGLPVLGCALLLATNAFPVIVAAAFVGMFNVNGRDRGAIPILEQAMFPATTTDADRTRIFAWYNVLLDVGYAAGGLLAGIPTALEHFAGMETLAAMKLTLALFAALYLASAFLYARLPPRVGDTAPAGLRELSPESRPIIRKISTLFFVDAFAGGFIGSAIFAYWFSERFGASAATVAVLFSAGRLLSAASHIAAAWLAKRIGLVNTMVFTHIPSSFLLFTIVIADDFGWAAFFFLVREALNEMDVPTRQSYVMAVVKPSERLAAAGVTNLVRSGGWALAPVFAGALMQSAGLGVPLVLAGVAKIGYDIALWREFRRVKPPEER
ncbi:MAG: MFS transporter [Betaproteobacteria bacterium]|nr:MFS transporter [Betaproteobacteria bacterium]